MASLYLDCKRPIKPSTAAGNKPELLSSAEILADESRIQMDRKKTH